MADFKKIKQDIKDEIRPNGIGSITGKIMQDILIELAETTEEKLEEQAEAFAEGAAKTNEEISKTNEAVQANAADIAKANEELTKKAGTEDYYPKMSVGFADNLVGREVATPEQFTYRASAGEKSIGDEGARIKRIKGNTVVQDGELISMHTEAIRTVGFNQWDEQWELGSISYADGTNVESVNQIRSKNYIPILEGYDYYWNRYGYVRCYDAQKRYIGGLLPATDNGWSDGGVIKVSAFPANTAYIRFWVSSTYGTSYKNDICINLSHTAYKNGTYSPYRTFTRQLPDLGVMRSAGEAFDEIRFNSEAQKWEKVTRIGEVDLGSLTWTADVVGDKVGFVVRNKVVNPPADFYSKVNMLCAELTTVTQSGNTQYANDKVIFANVNGWLQAADHRYTDATSFKSAMQGVMLYYELAEPIIKELDWPADTNLDYAVEDFGTEEAISSMPSAPFSADIIYPFNAVDTIRANEREIQALKTTIQQMSATMSMNHEE